MDMNQKTREHETHHSHDTITVQHCFHEHDQKHEHVHGHHHHHGKLPAMLYMIGLVIFVASLILLTGFEQKIFLLVAMILSGYHVLLEGVVDTIEASLTAHRLRPNAHILMFIAAMGAVYLGDIKEGALLIFIFAGVHFLEAHTLNTQDLPILHLENYQVTIRHIHKNDCPQLLGLEQIDSQQFLVLETFETPYDMNNPHLELQMIQKN